VKYSPANSAITICLTEKGGQAVVNVRDTGVGIAPEMLNRVFDLFMQSEATLDRSDGGLGVGLTLVKAIIELHGGSVFATSDGPGTGSEFTIQLPLVSAPSASEPSPSMTNSLRENPSRPLRIAIVEDNADSRSTLQSLLELDGHETRTASDGLRGVELILAWQPDVAVVDIGLPILDGFEVARQVRAKTQSPNAQAWGPHLIALTGYGLPSDRDKVLSAGFDLHLVKPLKLPELRIALSKRPKARRTE
jgi:CheY-like chemotaxis protein